MNDTGSITHIADTALWVATYRALETERPDALFHDRFADLLSGERGRQIAASMPYPKVMAWALVIRTVAIDELIKQAISIGVDTVVNLGAGLDTRPYRMELPAGIRWIEVDFPQMIAYKTEKLAGQQPTCKLERIAADLSDLPLRRTLFSRIGSESRKALVITEGVIVYLTNEESASLSNDILAVPSFQYWIQDYYQQGMRRMPRKMRDRLKESPFKFDSPDWLAFFEGLGWKILAIRFAGDEADRLKRPFPMIFPWTLVMLLMPKKLQERYRRSSGYVMLQRTATPT
jgi:methyltransferase (TIGR00027 family)